jgi:hypothetical protein
MLILYEWPSQTEGAASAYGGPVLAGRGLVSPGARSQHEGHRVSSPGRMRM